MSMESVAYNTMYRGLSASRKPSKLPKGTRRSTVRRIAAFARPHRRKIAVFLALSVLTAVLTVVTPILAGRVVNQITGHGSTATITWLALVIAGVALAEAGVGIVVRWLSASIGEGLILDLRRTVYDHVQKMPVAFFTRTRTGALVSRLNNDVIGAQRAFSDTLSGVVSNIVTLALTLTTMLLISWQITLLALVLLPVFVVPARLMGRRMAALSRQAAEYNAQMSTQMTER
ncbi:MAG: ABC transporter ATP-binding protein, partial [Williamsia herbipolensis]|nr:ABC transporter ATP-binding protein [Williamsia herbipolensis]